MHVRRRVSSRFGRREQTQKAVMNVADTSGLFSSMFLLRCIFYSIIIKTKLIAVYSRRRGFVVHLKIYSKTYCTITYLSNFTGRRVAKTRSQ